MVCGGSAAGGNPVIPERHSPADINHQRCPNAGEVAIEEDNFVPLLCSLREHNTRYAIDPGPLGVPSVAPQATLGLRGPKLQCCRPGWAPGPKSSTADYVALPPAGAEGSPGPPLDPPQEKLKSKYTIHPCHPFHLFKSLHINSWVLQTMKRMNRVYFSITLDLLPRSDMGKG